MPTQGSWTSALHLPGKFCPLMSALAASLGRAMGLLLPSRSASPPTGGRRLAGIAGLAGAPVELVLFLSAHTSASSERLMAAPLISGACSGVGMAPTCPGGGPPHGWADSGSLFPVSVVGLTE